MINVTQQFIANACGIDLFFNIDRQMMLFQKQDRPVVFILGTSAMA